MRAHGKTTSPAGELNISVLAEDVVSLAQALQLDRPYICGWSMGDDTVLEIAIRHPGMARAVVMGGVAHRLSDQFFAVIKGIGIEGPGQVNFEQMEKTAPELIEMSKALHTQGPDYWKTLLVQISPLILEESDNAPEEFQRITEPVLVILGDRDEYIPAEDGVELYRLIPGAELAVIPGSDHSVTRTQAELFANIVVDFMLRHST